MDALDIVVILVNKGNLYERMLKDVGGKHSRFSNYLKGRIDVINEIISMIKAKIDEEKEFLTNG